MFKFMVGSMAGLALAGALVTGAGANDEARVRVIHASPDAPNVDIYANDSAVLTDLPFEASSGYLEVPAGAYTFEVFPAGSDAGSSEPVLVIDAVLEGNTDYTVVAMGEVANIEAGVFVDDNAAPANGQAHVNVIHAGPDAPAVDIAVAGGPVLVPNLAFSEKAGPLPVDAGTYGLEVRPTGTEDVALPLDGIAIEAGSIYTFVATGFLEGDPALSVLAFAEQPVEVASQASPSMAPPSAGSAGFMDQSEGGNTSAYLLGGGVIIALIVVAGLARRVAVRS